MQKMQSMHYFMWSRFVREAGLIVFLNKQDLLKKKILEHQRKLETYFPDYAKYTPSKKDEWDGRDEYEKAKLYMRHKVLVRFYTFVLESFYIFCYVYLILITLWTRLWNMVVK